MGPNGPQWAPMGPMGPIGPNGPPVGGPPVGGPGPLRPFGPLGPLRALGALGALAGPWGPWAPCGPLGPGPQGSRAPAGPMGPAVTTVSLVPCGGATPYYLSIKVRNKKPSYKQVTNQTHVCLLSKGPVSDIHAINALNFHLFIVESGSLFTIDKSVANPRQY